MAHTEQSTKARYANKRRFYGNRYINVNKSNLTAETAQQPHVNNVELRNDISTASAAKIITVVTEFMPANISDNQ